MEQFFAWALAAFEIAAWPGAFLIAVFAAKRLVEDWGRGRRRGIDDEVWALLRTTEFQSDEAIGSGVLDERSRVWSEELAAMSVGSGMVGVQAGWIGVVTAANDLLVGRFTREQRPYNLPAMVLSDALTSAGVDAQVVQVLRSMRRVRLMVVSEKGAFVPDEIGRRYGIVAARMRARLEAYAAEKNADGSRDE